MHHDDFEQKKQEKEFEDLKRHNQEWLDKHLDELAEFLVDLWLSEQEQKDKNQSDESGSILTGSEPPKR